MCFSFLFSYVMILQTSLFALAKENFGIQISSFSDSCVPFMKHTTTM